jgi:DNA-binding response OmpR family regulator
VSRILIVEIEHDLMAKLASDLGDSGYRTDLMIGEELLSSENDTLANYDVFLLEIGAEDAGLVRSKLKQAFEGMRKPPLLLVGTEEQMHTSDALADADDFMLAPVSVFELNLRVKVALSRAGRYDDTDAIQRGDLRIHPHTYEVVINGERVDLTLKEYELLKFLATHAGRVFTRDVLLEQVWGYDYYGGMRTVDVHVRRLRAKLEREGHTFIETIRGVGYRFVVQE